MFYECVLDFFSVGDRVLFVLTLSFFAYIGVKVYKQGYWGRKLELPERKKKGLKVFILAMWTPFMLFMAYIGRSELIGWIDCF